jgi:hypothetical protein
MEIELLEGAPVLSTHWNAQRRDENIVRFGLMWKSFDLVGFLGLDYCPGILPSSDTPLLGGYLLGGFQGTDFLVSARGLEQPWAGGRGWYKLT